MLRVACSKRSDSGERCEVKKAVKSRGGLLFTSQRSPLTERLEQAMLRDVFEWEAISLRQCALRMMKQPSPVQFKVCNL